LRQGSSKLKVMIADENRLMLEGFRRALEGVEDIMVVAVTHSGSELLSLIERRRPEVIALDLAMRAPDGRSCLDLVRNAYPELTVVVLSATAAPQTIRSALSRGARAFITKSVDPLDIPSALRQAHDGTVYHALASAPGSHDDVRTASLTRREITMLEALARGLSNKAISEELWVTEQTVKFHLGNLYRKLGVPNRLAAASYAHTHGIPVS
jgi:DNA-binding NarL/FixJ family response regulator